MPAIAFRFVHTADLHLDSPLRSLALREPRLAEAVGAATRAALAGIVDLCLSERVAALLIAGDLYDSDQASMKTARYLADQFARLGAAGIRVVLIRGNHDAAARITGALELPDNVHVFGARPGTLRLEAGGVDAAIHGVSFPARGAPPEHPLRRFPAPVAGAVNIGMLHTSLGGAPGHDPYAPVSLSELAGTGYDYWALGHLHARQVHGGRPVVVMPGMPQGRDVGEAGPKSVTLAGIGAGGAVTLAEHPSALVEFARCEASLAGATGWGDVAAAMAAALRAAREASGAPDLVLRLRLSGATPLAWRLRRDRDMLADEAARQAEALGGVWVEAVESACVPPPAGAPAAEGTPAASGALAELQRILAAEVSPGLDADLAALQDEVVRALPPELRPRFPAEPGPAAELRAALLAEGIADVLARLHDAGDG